LPKYVRKVKKNLSSNSRNKKYCENALNTTSSVDVRFINESRRNDLFNVGSQNRKNTIVHARACVYQIAALLRKSAETERLLREVGTENAVYS